MEFSGVVTAGVLESVTHALSKAQPSASDKCCRQSHRVIWELVLTKHILLFATENSHGKNDLHRKPVCASDGKLSNVVSSLLVLF